MATSKTTCTGCGQVNEAEVDDDLLAIAVVSFPETWLIVSWNEGERAESVYFCETCKPKTIARLKAKTDKEVIFSGKLIEFRAIGSDADVSKEEVEAELAALHASIEENLGQMLPSATRDELARGYTMSDRFRTHGPRRRTRS